MKGDTGRGNGDDLLEDTTDRQSDDGSTLKQGEFGRGHEKGQDAWKEQDAGTDEDASNGV